MADNVNHPSHYETGKFECIDVMIETQGLEATKNFCICNAFKYIYRHNGKNGYEDICKAKWYLDKYIELVEENMSKKKAREVVLTIMPDCNSCRYSGFPEDKEPCKSCDDLSEYSRKCDICVYYEDYDENGWSMCKDCINYIHYLPKGAE